MTCALYYSILTLEPELPVGDPDLNLDLPGDLPPPWNAASYQPLLSANHVDNMQNRQRQNGLDVKNLLLNTETTSKDFLKQVQEMADHESQCQAQNCRYFSEEQDKMILYSVKPLSRQ